MLITCVWRGSTRRTAMLEWTRQMRRLPCRTRGGRGPVGSISLCSPPSCNNHSSRGRRSFRLLHILVFVGKRTLPIPHCEPMHCSREVWGRQDNQLTTRRRAGDLQPTQRGASPGYRDQGKSHASATQE
ncbi:hypothetical protein BD413DRAFT_36906 [Trametes elegans]|nr:hypothetical protein BD413DRAFT_36906 [Trametes elegans]